MNSKQVIVMRSKFPDANGKLVGVRKGKFISQGCHASLAFLTDVARRGLFAFLWNAWCCFWDKEVWAWMTTSFAKVVCQVETEQELRRLHEEAIKLGLRSHLVIDSGRTEFGGIPTVTALAIGPAESSKIDLVTGKLELF